MSTAAFLPTISPGGAYGMHHHHLHNAHHHMTTTSPSTSNTSQWSTATLLSPLTAAPQEATPRATHYSTAYNPSLASYQSPETHVYTTPMTTGGDYLPHYRSSPSLSARSPLNAIDPALNEVNNNNNNNSNSTYDPQRRSSYSMGLAGTSPQQQQSQQQQQQQQQQHGGRRASAATTSSAAGPSPPSSGSPSTTSANALFTFSHPSAASHHGLFGSAAEPLNPTSHVHQSSNTASIAGLISPKLERWNPHNHHTHHPHPHHHHNSYSHPAPTTTTRGNAVHHHSHSQQQQQLHGHHHPHHPHHHHQQQPHYGASPQLQHLRSIQQHSDLADALVAVGGGGGGGAMGSGNPAPPPHNPLKRRREDDDDETSPSSSSLQQEQVVRTGAKWFTRRSRNGASYTVCPKQKYRCLYGEGCDVVKDKACQIKDHYQTDHARFNTIQCGDCGSSYARPCTFKRHLKQGKCPKKRPLTTDQLNQGKLRDMIMQCFSNMTDEEMVLKGIRTIKECNKKDNMHKRKRCVGSTSHGTRRDATPGSCYGGGRRRRGGGAAADVDEDDDDDDEVVYGTGGGDPQQAMGLGPCATPPSTSSTSTSAYYTSLLSTPHQLRPTTTTTTTTTTTPSTTTSPLAGGYPHPHHQQPHNAHTHYTTYHSLYGSPEHHGYDTSTSTSTSTANPAARQVGLVGYQPQGMEGYW